MLRYTREKNSSETSESVLTDYGFMLIMPNQESEWDHQVIRNIPSPALSIQWDNKDIEAKESKQIYQMSWTDWEPNLPIW